MIVMFHSYSCFFFFKQKTAYEMRISDWSSDVCSSDLLAFGGLLARFQLRVVLVHFLVIDLLAGQQRCIAAVGDLDLLQHLANDQIGRASCRERVCQYV